MSDDVCLISTFEVPCGIAAYTADLIKGLTGHGVSTRVATIDRRVTAYLSREELTRYFERVADEAAGASVVHIQHEFSFFAGSYGMAESIRNFGQLLKLLRSRSGKIVVTFHSMPILPGWRTGSARSMVRQALLRRYWRRSVMRAFNRRGVRAIAPSRYLRRLLIDSGLKAGSITVIPQGVPAAKTISSEQRSDARRELGYEDDDYLMTLFGFVSPYKGHDVALDALENLPDQYKLVIVGGPHPEGVDLGYELALTKAESTELAGRATVTGYVPFEKVRAYLNASDLCLMPYVDSGLATSAAAMWALSSGKPVLASKIPAFQELYDTASCLTLVNPNAPHELARAVVDLSKDERAVAALVENAKHYSGLCSWRNVAATHLELYGIETLTLELAGTLSDSVSEKSTTAVGLNK